MAFSIIGVQRPTTTRSNKTTVRVACGEPGASVELEYSVYYDARAGTYYTLGTRIGEPQASHLRKAVLAAAAAANGGVK